MEICVFVKNRFFRDFFPQIVAFFATAWFLCPSTKCIMPIQAPKTQELGRFAASFRRLRSEKPLASGGGFAPSGGAKEGPAGARAPAVKPCAPAVELQ